MKNLKKQILFSLVAFALVISQSLTVYAQGNHWYTSPSGSGTSCTSSAPCSFSTVQTKALSGDIIHASGTFNTRQKLTISNITLTGGTFSSGLDVRGNLVTLQALEVLSSGQICVIVYGHDVILDNILAHECFEHGILVTDTYNVTVKNSTVYHASMMNKSKTMSGGWSSGIKVKTSNNILLENNTVFNNYGEGFGLRGSFITVRGNTVYDNYSVGIYANSDNLLVERNFVYCTGNPEFDRAGLPMNGIAIGEEYFPDWGAHAYNETVINNIVSGCKYGFSYNGSDTTVTGGGLKNSVIAFNTFYQTRQAGVRILYESAQANVLVANNITTTAPNVDNPTGITLASNRAVTLSGGITPGGYKLSQAQAASSIYSQTTDFGGLRVAPYDIGAWDFGGISATPTKTSAAFTPTRTPTPVLTVTKTPTPTKTLTPAATKTSTTSPTRTPTPVSTFTKTSTSVSANTPTKTRTSAPTLTATPLPSATLPASTLVTGLYENTFSGLVYSGAWAMLTNSGASGGNLHYSQLIADSVTFTFYGNAFSLLYSTNSNQGIMVIYVDGVLVASLNQSSLPSLWRNTWISPAFTNGIHTVLLKHTSGGAVTLDGIQIP